MSTNHIDYKLNIGWIITLLFFILAIIYLFPIEQPSASFPLIRDTHDKHTNCSLPTKDLYVVQVSTNLVYKPCSCGFCDPSKGIYVPEHVNSIGHDLHYEISTNYLQVTSMPIKVEHKEVQGGLLKNPRFSIVGIKFSIL